MYPALGKKTRDAWRFYVSKTCTSQFICINHEYGLWQEKLTHVENVCKQLEEIDLNSHDHEFIHSSYG